MSAQMLEASPLLEVEAVLRGLERDAWLMVK